jgi:predicted ABC-type ATPase
MAMPDADLAVARVAERVRHGGHDVPEAVVRRRFAAGLRHFLGVYRGVADTWQMFDNSGLRGPRLIAFGRNAQDTTVLDAGAWAHLTRRDR